MKKLGLLAILLMALPLLSACGGDTATSTPAAPTAPAASAPTSTTAAASAPTSTTAAMAAPTNTTAAMAAPTDTAGTGAATGSTQEGTLTVYTALEDDQLQRYMAVFQKSYPNVKLNLVRDSTGVVTAKLLAEKDNPQADVVWGLAATSLLVADKQGMLVPYAPAGVDRVQANFKDQQSPPHWVGIDVWESAFCVNTAEIQAKNLPMPKSWADLTNPVYKGYIVMPDPSSSGTGFLSVSGILQMKGEDAGWKYLDDLNQNIAQYVHSGSQPCTMSGTGEYPIGISFGYRALQEKQAGSPVEPVWPTEGSGWDLEANALVKKANINPLSKSFLDWAISDPIMVEYQKSYPITSVKTNQPAPEGYVADPVKQLAKNDLNWAADNRQRILDEWNQRYASKAAPTNTPAPAAAATATATPKP
jgi:iron(III) transport system substrate-binding protein